jgi:hypothetical protein
MPMFAYVCTFEYLRSRLIAARKIRPCPPYVPQGSGIGRWTKNPKDYLRIPLRIKAIRMPALSPVPCECPGFGFSTSGGSGDRR